MRKWGAAWPGIRGRMREDSRQLAENRKKYRDSSATKSQRYKGKGKWRKKNILLFSYLSLSPVFFCVFVSLWQNKSSLSG